MSERIEPAGWAPPSGYANGILASGRMLAIAGPVGWDARQQLVSVDFLAQAVRAMRNVADVLRTAGGDPEHLVRMTWYVLDAAEYRANAKALGTAYREIFGNHYPAMTLIVVAGLLEAGARVEIEATAVLPALDD